MESIGLFAPQTVLISFWNYCKIQSADLEEAMWEAKLGSQSYVVIFVKLK